MRCCRVSHGCGNLRRRASVPPPASNLRMCGYASLCAIGQPQTPLGDPRHLWLPAKQGGHSFCLSEDIMNSKTRLAGVAVGNLCEDAKARPQHMFSLKLQIALQIDQAQTVLPSRVVACWSFSLKDSCVRASIKKCANTFWRLKHLQNVITS
jgi:hypothetical protein